MDGINLIQTGYSVDVPRAVTGTVDCICANIMIRSAPPGYPIVHDFKPDIDTFYTQWLGRAAP